MNHWGITKRFIRYRFTGVLLLLSTFVCDDATIPQNHPIYIAGVSQPQGLPESRAVYWKNGEIVSVGKGPKNSGLNSIFVDGKNTYVAGWESNVVFPDDFLNYRHVAKFWKNGVAISLGDENFNSEATSIFVEGENVYVCGFEDARACYWKNGIRIPLTLNTRVSTVTEVVVKSGDVYLVGSEQNPTIQTATYWKNGMPISLTDGTRFSDAFSIALDDEGNVHVVGVAFNGSEIVGKYWRNGSEVPIADGRKTRFNSIKLDQGNVYILGVLDDKVAVWKNEQLQFLESGVTAPSMLFISDQSVFTCGTEFLNNDPLLFTYVGWKNNSKLPFGQQFNSRAAAIFVTEQ